MRLRLRIERHALPAVQVVWPVDEPSDTIAQMLSKINAIFPIEADTWGFEDYAILLGSYELVHYYMVSNVLKDDDALVIKPLGLAGKRARTLTGRDRISVDGRHLLDGVAWHRPALKAPLRPDISIPPRKKRRLSRDDEESEDDEEDGDFAEQLLLTDGADEDGEESSVEDEDELLNEHELDYLEGLDDEEIERLHQVEAERMEKLLKRRKKVHFKDDPKNSASSSEASSTDEEDSEGSNSSDSSEISSDESSQSDEEEPWEGLTEGDPPVPEPLPKRKLRSSTAASKQQTSLKGSEEFNPTTRTTATRQAHQKEAPQHVGIPGEGKATTTARNVRRREAKRLKHAKLAGDVPQDTTLAEYREMIEGTRPMAPAEAGAQVNGDANADAPQISAEGSKAAETLDTPSDQAPTKKRKRSKKTTTTYPDTPANIEDQRQKLLKAIDSGGIDVDASPLDGTQNQADAPEELSSKAQTTLPTTEPTPALDMSPPSANTRRARLDLAGSQRLLFGSLGVRVPKTPAEKEALQKKLAEKNTRKPVVKPIPAAESNADDTSATLSKETETANPEAAWQAKINLTAVECVDEGVTLSQPPFPFHQRWDPQYNRRGKKRAASGGAHMENGGGSTKKRRKRGDGAVVRETYDKYNTDGYGDALNYDDEEEEEYWEEGALLDGDGDGGDEEEVEDFPALPEDLTTLPVITAPGDANVDDIITYAELACDDSTGWQPRTVRRTAKILGLPSSSSPSAGNETGTGTFKVELARRDVKAPVFDEEGRRVYGKFEMPRDEDGEGEVNEQVREVEWKGLGEVRRVKAGAGDEAEG